MKIQPPTHSQEKQGASTTLHQALTPTTPKRLPSNFAYTTMQRIRREQREAERRQYIAAIACIATVSLLGLGTVSYFFGKAFLCSLIAFFSQPGDLSLVPPTLFCLAFFALLNSWLMRHYSHHSPSNGAMP
jgi:formate hydrogenlyase subunit 3/multisubunit Na+/H+ antiporter MnhD subunit